MKQTAESAKTPRLQVTQLWGERVVDLAHFRSGADVLIGSGKRADFTVHGAAVGESFSLARLEANLVQVRVPRGASVQVLQSGAETRSGEALRAAGRLVQEGGVESLSLGLNERAVITLETGAFVVRPVAAPEREPVHLLGDGDYTYFKIASYALMSFVAVTLAIALTPEPEAPNEDTFTASRLAVRGALPPKRIELTQPSPSEGARAAEPEGKVGREESRERTAPRSKERPSRTAVKRAGLLGALQEAGDAHGVFSQGGLGAGIANAIGGLEAKGPAVADQQGIGGMGSRGTGPGGGDGSLSIGTGLGTRGPGPGRAGDGVGLEMASKERVRIEVGKDVLIDGLDRDVIAKVVREKQREIKHCYDSELRRDPSLAGKVAVAWTIDSSGSVSDAFVSEGLGNAELESCMLAKIRRWKFPQPKSGGIVAVNFPWIFNNAESP